MPQIRCRFASHSFHFSSSPPRPFPPRPQMSLTIGPMTAALLNVSNGCVYHFDTVRGAPLHPPPPVHKPSPSPRAALKPPPKKASG